MNLPDAAYNRALTTINQLYFMAYLLNVLHDGYFLHFLTIFRLMRPKHRYGEAGRLLDARSFLKLVFFTNLPISLGKKTLNLQTEVR